MSIALILLAQCTIQQNITIQIQTDKTMAKKKIQLVTKYNGLHKTQFHKNNGKSMAVQHEAYTIKELLEKHSSGLMPPIGLTPQYDTEEPSHDDSMLLRKQDLDLTDIDDIKTQVADTEKKLAKQKASAKKKTHTNDRSSVDKDGTDKTQRSGETEE